MRVVRTVGEVREAVRAARKAGRAVSLVPTMGFLHEGHASLMRAAGVGGAYVVVSVYVNPLQFGPKEDLGSYPRDEARDLRVCEGAGVDLLFVPDHGEVYVPGHSTFVTEEALSGVLCGASRPGHFRGVATVVLKLLLIVQPDRAVFGRKDAQQLAVIRRMVRDLNVPVDVIAGPTVRESDGLAMSSRNAYLSAVERERARCLSAALRLARDRYEQGVRAWAEVRSVMLGLIESGQPPAQIDYVSAVDALSLMPVDELRDGVLVALAVRIGRTRLIDNTILGDAEW